MTATSTIITEGNLLNPSTYLELFDFDMSTIGGGISYYTNTETGGATTPIVWKNNSYYPLPFDVKGYDVKSDGTAPTRPTIQISNVNKFLMAAVLSLGDLIGTRVTRWRTFYKFTDQGTEPNPAACYPVEQYVITRKLPSTFKQTLMFEMSNALDRPGLMLPRRQILRDLGFPGVSRTPVR